MQEHHDESHTKATLSGGGKVFLNSLLHSASLHAAMGPNPRATSGLKACKAQKMRHCFGISLHPLSAVSHGLTPITIRLIAAAHDMYHFAGYSTKQLLIHMLRLQEWTSFRSTSQYQTSQCFRLQQSLKTSCTDNMSTGQ